MEFDWLNPVPIVQQKPKSKNFTVTTIGGPEEIKLWRQQQEAKETLFRMRLGARNERAKAFEMNLGETLSKPTIHTTTWQEKQAFVQSERERLAMDDERVFNRPAWEYVEEPNTLSIYGKFKEFIKNVWNNANT